MSEKQTPHPLHDAEKSWPQVHKMIRLARVKAQNIEKNAIAMAKETDELIQLCKEIIPHVPKTDGTLFGFSPMAPAMVIEYLTDQIFKVESQERHFARRIKARTYEAHRAPNFSDAMNLALSWALKMEKEALKNIV